MRFSMNTIGLYPGKSFAEAFASLKAAGYSAFELWSLEKTDLPALKKDMDAYSMTLTTCCPSYFVLNEESCHDRYEAGIRQAIRDCRFLGCRELITQVGQDSGRPRDEQHAAIVRGLKRVAPLLEEAGITLTVEPLNDVKDHKGYYLTDSDEGFAIIREVGSPNVKLLYDVYHQHHMGEDVFTRVAENLDLIAHFHIAGHPDRDEKIFENFDYRPFFALLKEKNVNAYVGVELFPKTSEATEELLKKLAAFEDRD